MLRIFSLLLLLPLFSPAQTTRVDRYLEGEAAYPVQSTWYAAGRPLLDIFYKNGLTVAKTTFTYSDTSLVRRQEWLHKPGDSLLIVSVSKIDERHLRTDQFNPDGSLQQQLLLTLDTAGRTLISELYVFDRRKKRIRACRYEFAYPSKNETTCIKLFNDSLREHDRSSMVPELPPDITRHTYDAAGRLERTELVFFKEEMRWGARTFRTHGETRKLFYSSLHPDRLLREVTDNHGGPDRTKYRYHRNGKVKRIKRKAASIGISSCARFNRQGQKTREWEKEAGSRKRHYYFIVTPLN